MIQVKKIREISKSPSTWLLDDLDEKEYRVHHNMGVLTVTEEGADREILMSEVTGSALDDQLSYEELREMTRGLFEFPEDQWISKE